MATHQPGRATPSPPAACAAARLAHALAPHLAPALALHPRHTFLLRRSPHWLRHATAPPPCARARRRPCLRLLRPWPPLPVPCRGSAPARPPHAATRRAPAGAPPPLDRLRPPPATARFAMASPRRTPLRATARCARDPPPVRAPGPMTPGAHPRMF
nr:atherin-like [Aegilops tauschii subsp. strangulata]